MATTKPTFKNLSGKIIAVPRYNRENIDVPHGKYVIGEYYNSLWSVNNDYKLYQVLDLTDVSSGTDPDSEDVIYEYIITPVATTYSVGLSMPSEFSVANTPVTTSGTLTVTEAVQAKNTVYAVPSIVKLVTFPVLELDKSIVTSASPKSVGVDCNLSAVIVGISAATNALKSGAAFAPIVGPA